MKELPSYNKIFTLGQRGTERVLEGPVVIQEKYDGSQFRFGRNEDGELIMGSHHTIIYGDGGMFAPAVESVKMIETRLPKDTWYFAEFLGKPKHNTLAYGRVPKGHLVLFDVAEGNGVFWPWQQVQEEAAVLWLEPAKTLHAGPATKETLDLLLQMESSLGKELIEGVVVKNYDEQIAVGGRLIPVFAKLVRQQFKERHSAEWVTGKGKLENFISTFCTEARWLKVVQHRRDLGELLDAPQDIGPLIKLLEQDILDEEKEAIKDGLFKLFIQDIQRAARKNFPDWYKAQLTERIQ